jgi:hypothetical protein
MSKRFEVIMVSILLFVCAIIFTVCHLTYKHKWGYPSTVEIFLSYILLFNMGFMGLLGAAAHVFMAPETAQTIGWAPGSPFQFEVGMANLAFGVLGILCYWFRGAFWDASIIGWSVLFFGCFVGHVMDYYATNNTASYNIGPYIWFYDLLLPILVLGLLYYLRFCGNKA